jgi:hypothetical protein
VGELQALTGLGALMKLIENKSNEIVYYDLISSKLMISDEITSHDREVQISDFNSYVNNGLFTLRRPGFYRNFMGLCSIPPKTNWLVGDGGYQFHSERRYRLVPDSKSVQDVENLALRYIEKLKINKPIIELSGGLDTSIIIDFFLQHGLSFKLLGFVSDRYEFRTERKIQEYYFDKASQAHLLKYEDYPAFANLKKLFKHPVPAQESLFFNRHDTVAAFAKKHGDSTVLTGEAGDQLLGFSAVDIQSGKRLPEGNYYWSLAEHWCNQFVYKPNGVDYVSALAIGLLPAIILSLREKKPEDIMKLWARRQLHGRLPRMLTDFAYKGFHDGWVSQGLIIAKNDVVEMARLTFDKVPHEDLSPASIVRDLFKYSQLPDDRRSYFLARLSFVAWCYAYYSND